MGTLTDDLLVYALKLGFDVVGVAPVGPPRYGEPFTAWLADGCHGEMTYLALRAAERLAPERWAPGTQSMVILALNYGLGAPPPQWEDPHHGRFARYAWTPDYHDVIKSRLFELDAYLRAQTGRAMFGKAAVDTAPVLERDYAEQAGLGFIGRNTCLITPGVGSWTYLAALLVPERLEMTRVYSGGTRWSARSAPGCGKCTRCLAACPSGAFTGPYVLDARRCISYLTIELRGPIPRDLRAAMGNWVFGCDVCQVVCPYNRSAPVAASPLLVPDRGRATLPLAELLALDDAAFRERYRGTSVWRTKRRGLVRNACVAAGNSGDPAFGSQLVTLLADDDPLVRGHAAWALGRLRDAAAHRSLTRALSGEQIPWVHEEMTQALSGRGDSE